MLLPYYNIHFQRIESIQKKFLMFALRHFKFDENNTDPNNKYRLPPNEDRLKLINLQPLQVRAINQSLVFMFDVLNGRIKCNNLKNLFIPRIDKYDFRTKHLFTQKFHRTNYGKYSPINRLSCLANNCTCLSDVNNNRNKFLKCIKSHSCNLNIFCKFL